MERSCNPMDKNRRDGTCEQGGTTVLPGTLVCVHSVPPAATTLRAHLNSTKRKPAVREREMCDRKHGLPPRPHRQVPILCWRIVNELTGAQFHGPRRGNLSGVNNLPIVLLRECSCS